METKTFTKATDAEIWFDFYAAEAAGQTTKNKITGIDRLMNAIGKEPWCCALSRKHTHLKCDDPAFGGVTRMRINYCPRCGNPIA